MSWWFFISSICLIGSVIPHILSVEHLGLEKSYGREKGEKLGKMYGIISATMESIGLIGVLISPQPRFEIPFIFGYDIQVLFFSIPLHHLLLSLPVICVGVWVAFRGLKAVGFEVAETHGKVDKVQTHGIYAKIRHPQYLGWILSHLGITVLLSALFALYFTPILIIIVYVISRKEENELILEFGDEYVEYKNRVPMMIPRIFKSFKRQND